MERFKFIGDPLDNGSGPDSTKIFGLEFSRGDYTPVYDPVLVEKLRRNRHFAEAWGSDAPVATASSNSLAETFVNAALGEYKHQIAPAPMPAKPAAKRKGWPKGVRRGPRKPSFDKGLGGAGNAKVEIGIIQQGP